MLRAISVFLLNTFFLISLSAHAAPMDELVQLLSFDAFKASFKQSTRDKQQAELQKLDGVMQLQKPDRFYWQSFDPYPQQLISNGKVIWHFDADLEQVVIQEYAKQAERAPMMLIFRDGDALAKTFKLVKTDNRQGLKVFELQAIDAAATIRKVELGFKGKQLQQLRFVDHLEQTTDVSFSDVLLNQLDPATKFEFIIPEGADVLYE